ncbi:MAG: ImmA/IrrE family metallo-endopeptidase [Flavobacteriales bacterium]
MSQRTTVPINPPLLKWAMKESGYTLERVAKAIPVKEEKLKAWLNAELQPTMRQVEKLAHFLQRPFSIFFLPSPPNLTPLAAEYRRLPKVTPGEESPELRLALRRMLLRRDTALELMAELGEQPPSFTLAGSVEEGAEVVAERLRAALGIRMADQLAWPSEYRAWNTWREAAENLGVLVFQFGSVPLKEVRGVALLRQPMPVVGINTKEIPEGRIYTLVHELVHIMLANAKEEVAALNEHSTEKQWQVVERFAEEATSLTLVPTDALREVTAQLRLAHGPWTIENIRKLARRFRITPLAMATRLASGGYMSWPQYHAWRKIWDAYVEQLPARKGGPVAQSLKAIGRNGRPFTALVLGALAANRITSVDAARYLDLKFHHFDDLRTRLVQGPANASSE